MKQVRAHNKASGSVLAARVKVADTRISRAVGLLGRRGLEDGEALWIIPSRGVHTWGMRFSIDVVALDRDGVVVDAVSAMQPWRMRLPRPGTVGVLELPAGVLERTGTCLGDRIVLEGMEEAVAAGSDDVRDQ